MNKIIGIDLGTSTSEVGVLIDGKAIVIPNSHEEVIMPSVVNILADGNCIVGAEAKEKLLLEPENTFMEVKRLMGSDNLLTAHRKNYTPEKISSFILRKLVENAESHLQEEIHRAVITVPAYFSDIQRKATVEAGLSRVDS